MTATVVGRPRRVMRKVILGLLVFAFANPLTAQTHRDVRLPLQQGRLSLLELSRHLLTEYGYAGEHLEFKDVRVDVSGFKGSLLLTGFSAAMGRTVKFRKIEGGRALSVRVDQTRMRVVRHRVKRKLATALSVIAGREILTRKYTLDLPVDLAKDASVVLCIHGVDANAGTFADLRRFLGKQGPKLRVGTFEYANDEAIDRVAEELAKRLAVQRESFPDRRFLIVAHSMGGLVARHMLQTVALDPKNVTMLIMVGTPNHGSRLSRLRPGLDLLEMLSERGDDKRLAIPFADGLGEAGWDMWPDSPFLCALNAKPRNQNVRYHIILGNKAMLSADEMAKLRKKINAKVSRLKHGDVVGKRIASWVADVHEIVDGEGDGAVSLVRGRLKGVEEVVVPRRHIELLRSAPEGDSQPVFEKILTWLRASRVGPRPKKAR